MKQRVLLIVTGIMMLGSTIQAQSGMACGVVSNNFTAFENDPTFQIVTKKEWKLDQMYVNQTGQEDTLLQGVSIAVDLELENSPNFLWVKYREGHHIAKDYPVKFVSGSVQGGVCGLKQLQLYHKYNGSLMYTYTILYVSEATLVLTTTQQDTEDPNMHHTLEYRFVPVNYGGN